MGALYIGWKDYARYTTWDMNCVRVDFSVEGTVRTCWDSGERLDLPVLQLQPGALVMFGHLFP